MDDIGLVDEDMHVWLEETFDPDYDWLEGIEDLRTNPVPGFGYEYEEKGEVHE